MPFNNATTLEHNLAAELVEIPQETSGPYPGDGTNGPDVLEQSVVVRSDIRSSFGTASGRAHGVPMTLKLTIKDLALTDGVFGDDSGVHELATVTGSVKRGLDVSLVVGVDTRTEATSQGVGGAPPGRS